jgi:hypothetical protein
VFGVPISHCLRFGLPPCVASMLCNSCDRCISSSHYCTPPTFGCDDMFQGLSQCFLISSLVFGVPISYCLAAFSLLLADIFHRFDFVNVLRFGYFF